MGKTDVAGKAIIPIDHMNELESKHEFIEFLIEHDRFDFLEAELEDFIDEYSKYFDVKWAMKILSDLEAE